MPFTTLDNTIIAQATNLQSVKNNIIPNVTNWTNPDAPYDGTDYWVDTKKGQSVVTAWDKLVLGGNGNSMTFPGLWQLEPKISIGFEVAKFLTNAAEAAAKNPKPPKFDIRLQPKGYNPATVSATGEIWTANDWQTLKTYLPNISPKKGNTAQPIAWNINHPMCALLGIDQVIVTDISAPRIVDQTLTIQISMLQYFPQGRIFLNPYGNAGGKNLGPKINAAANLQK